MSYGRTRGLVQGCASSGGRTDSGPESPLTEEARKDSLRSGRVARATRPFLFVGRGYAESIPDRDHDARDAAREQGQEVEDAKRELHELEEGDPPERLEDWPEGKAMYLTYGGPEGTAGYDEGPTRKLGPSSLEHHADGSVSIEGETVDDPERYKANEPIPGAPGDEDE
jgi:hypothetical protein